MLKQCIWQGETATPLTAFQIMQCQSGALHSKHNLPLLLLLPLHTRSLRSVPLTPHARLLRLPTGAAAHLAPTSITHSRMNPHRLTLLRPTDCTTVCTAQCTDCAMAYLPTLSILLLMEMLLPKKMKPCSATAATLRGSSTSSTALRL